VQKLIQNEYTRIRIVDDTFSDYFLIRNVVYKGHQVSWYEEGIKVGIRLSWYRRLRHWIWHHRLLRKIEKEVENAPASKYPWKKEGKLG
jgi:hypothetical protein